MEWLQNFLEKIINKYLKPKPEIKYLSGKKKK